MSLELLTMNEWHQVIPNKKTLPGQNWNRFVPLSSSYPRRSSSIVFNHGSMLTPIMIRQNDMPIMPISENHTIRTSSIGRKHPIGKVTHG